MFESNEDFDLDEEFLNVVTSTQIVSPKPKSMPPQNENTQNNSINVNKSWSKTNIFSSNCDDFDDDFLSDTIISISKPIFTKPNENKSEKSKENTSTKIIELLSSKKTFTNSVFKRLNDENVDELNKENKKICQRITEIISPPLKAQLNSTVVRQRKFPGPAGLLPEITGLANIKEISLPDDSNEIKPEAEINICSQNTKALFSNGPWQKMMNDFQEKFDSFLTLPQKFTISWLKEHATNKKLIQQKTPFLAAIIVNLTPDFTIKLKDATSEISGGIDSEICEEYNHALQPGAVIVLKQVGVLTFSLRGHYLSITKNNLVAIYPLNSQLVKGPSFLSNSSLIKCIKEAETNHNIESVSPKNQSRTPLSSNLGYLNARTAHSSFNSNNKLQTINSSNKNNFNVKIVNVGSNKEGGCDINSILSSTFAGIDTDSLFDDF